MFKRSWVRNLAPYTGSTFFTLIFCKNGIVCLKSLKINEKDAGVGPFFTNLNSYYLRQRTLTIPRGKGDSMTGLQFD